MSRIAHEVREIWEEFLSPIIGITSKNINVHPINNKTLTTQQDSEYSFRYNGKLLIEIKKNEVSKNDVLLNELQRKKSLLNSLLQSLLNIADFIIYSSGDIIKTKYKKDLYKCAFMKGLSEWFSGGQADSLIYELLTIFSNWSLRTYEGNHVKYGVLIQAQENSTVESIKICDFLQKDTSATIADGENLFYIVDSEGKLKSIQNYKSCSLKIDENKYIKKAPNVYAPYIYHNICALAFGQSFGITLSSWGDICCFKGREISMARINGRWIIFNFLSFYEVFKGTLLEGKKDIVEKIYQTCLDVAFARTGGCLAIIEESDGNKRKQLEGLLPKNEEYEKRLPIKKVLSENFWEFDRELRKDLLAVDGAGVLDSNGNILSMGAIIKNVAPQVDGGARTASAKTLSDYGLAIKISNDGYMEFYKRGNLVLKFK